MTILLFIVEILLFGLIGLLYWASSALPHLLREIAFNTRKEGTTGSDYKLMDVLSIVMKIFSVIVWLAGLILAIATLIAGDSMGGLMGF